MSFFLVQAEYKELIDPSWRIRLHEYIGGTVRELGEFSEVIGGVADHVHLLLALKSTHLD
ncbi:MAG: hypothetical protein P4L55_10505 [Syntrophobacteraceae bacterium]|nr:hypothetical protein [Syntrophobacteraceae bacterium]